jgi:pyruvate dehydrogenase E1 component alpha subunit
MAAVWKLPVIFVCQNNGYGEHTKLALSTAVPNIAIRAVAYGIPGCSVNGNDPLEMYEAARAAVERARAGGGPTLVEAKTFRFHGHHMGDGDAYMDKGEKLAAIARDPVPLYRAWLVAAGHATEDELAKLEALIDAEIDEAVEFTLSSPYPDVAELRRDVFKAEIPA